ncbi:hypothetical protein [Sedimenticola sp.]|uniref:hypothetical protein n=1 Tax=Sedimenticola sp. TaxID=1940285 RepID=UPI003D107254
MSFRWLAWLPVLLSANAFATGYPVEIFEYVDSTRVVAFINPSDVDETHYWHPFKEVPPLTIEKVAASIHQYVSSDAELKDATLEEIELRKLPHFEKQWHYMVKMRTEHDHQIKNRYFVVLMNGNVIPAIQEPQSIK